MLVAAAQQVLGEVQGGAGEPVRAGHGIAFTQHGFGLAAETNVEEIDNGLPERLALLHAPGMQRRVVVKLECVTLVDEAAEGIHAAGGDAFGGGRPERGVHAQTP